jgi:hypothetical protein
MTVQDGWSSHHSGCLCSNVTPDDGHGECPKHVEFLEIKVKIQLHLVGYIYTYHIFFLIIFYVYNTMRVHMLKKTS